MSKSELRAAFTKLAARFTRIASKPASPSLGREVRAAASAAGELLLQSGELLLEPDNAHELALLVRTTRENSTRREIETQMAWIAYCASLSRIGAVAGVGANVLGAVETARGESIRALVTDMSSAAVQAENYAAICEAVAESLAGDESDEQASQTAETPIAPLQLPPAYVLMGKWGISFANGDIEKCYEIVKDKSMTADDKFYRLSRIDVRFVDRSSGEIASLLNCTSNNIRGGKWWKSLRERRAQQAD